MREPGGNFDSKTAVLSRKNELLSQFNVLGRSQAVRHRILIPACEGSNPSAPASLHSLSELRLGKPSGLN
jgi:hypothetical protein